MLFRSALATIDKMRQYNVPRHLTSLGSQVRSIWRKYAEQYGLKIRIMGIEPLSHFKFCLNSEEEETALTTLFIQELLKRGFLASCSCYITYAHDQHIIQQYEAAIASVFKMLSTCVENRNIADFIKGPLLTTGFQRLN